MDRTQQGDEANSCWRPGLHTSAALLFCAILSAGCQPYSLRDQQTLCPSQNQHTALMPVSENACDTPGNLAQAESHFTAGAQQEEQQLAGCVDLYYRAATESWHDMESSSGADPNYQAAWQIYQQSLARLIATARQYGRLDPRGHLIVMEAGKRRVVPIAYYGFPWKPNEFCQVVSADDFHNDDIAHHYRTNGLGSSLVALRKSCGNEAFYPPRQHFPVTAVLRPARAGCPTSGPVLEFYNPYLFASVPMGPTSVGLNRDLTAPFACLLQDTPRKYTEGFVDPSDADVKPELFIMEPYQRGKIPVVFIHGLWSDPVTWVDAVNDLRAQGDIYRKYQFWFFRYPTGKGLLESAAVLREKLASARETFDPAHKDAAMEQMVLVGHSMGGLVAKLQTTYSYDILWRHAARRPLEAVRATPAMRDRLERVFFFDPSPLVNRVVFIGTPNQGSTQTRRLVGRVASSLVNLSGPEEEHYRQLMDNNRDVFAEYLWDSWPTSIDLLEPSNPMLQAMACIPFSRRVRLHTIIGTGGRTIGGEPGDGVVPVSSARHAGACSELRVPVRHEKLHRDAKSVGELMRILREQARESGMPLALPVRCK